MATVTFPKTARDLAEAQKRVRHPLERIRGTIRTYVGLEGAALLLTLLALWFWVVFVLDFGPFRLFGWDWVQEVPLRGRAVALGLLFLFGVIVLRLGLVQRLYGDEVSAIARSAFVVSKKRQTLPVWLRLPLLGLGVAVACWVADVVGVRVGSQDEASARLVAMIVAPLVALLITGAHELFGVAAPRVSRWVRAPVAALGAAGGALLGVYWGYVSFGGTAGAVILSALFAVAGDAFAVLNIGVVTQMLRRQAYLVALTVPCVVAYLLGWLIAGLVAGLSSWLAAGLVLLLMIGPVVAVVVGRLLCDFGDAALALVLERRFPRVLGDRLITAVELANPKKAARYGYSEAMIEKTIHDAAERVGEVPVSDVFDWKRLYRHWGGVAAVTVGVYLLAGVLFFIPAVADAGPGEHGGFTAFHQAAALVLERDLLLQNAIWPRRAYLEILDWPQNEKREKFVGKDASSLNIKVRASKWVTAAPDSTEGWRPLTWADLETNQHLLGEAAPEVHFRENDEHGKKDWGQPRDPNAGWTLDEIELRLGRDETHATLEAGAQADLRDVLSKLERRAADPAMKRTLRMLTLPTHVKIRYHGDRDSGELTLDRQADNEYSGTFPDLKDAVIFTARGEDYETPRHKITVVQPPSLTRILSDEQWPAYMFYRHEQDPAALGGLRQLVASRPVGAGGDASRIDSLPAGSSLVITAVCDKELDSVVIAEPRGGGGSLPAQTDVELLSDRRTFRVRFDNVRTPLDFAFRMTDTQNVKGERHVVIKPQEDAPPDVSIGMKLLRAKGTDFLVTPTAYIPLEAKVIDDRGLHQVQYACTVSKFDPQGDVNTRGLYALGALQLLPAGPGQELAAASRIAGLSRESKAGASGIQRFAAPGFQVPRKESLDLDAIQGNLDQPRPFEELKKVFELKGLEDKDSLRKQMSSLFSLESVKNPEGESLKPSNRFAEQPQYRIYLWMEALDTDVEGGKEVLKSPGGRDYHANRGRSTQTITLRVVSEDQLLHEIALEEDGLATRLNNEIAGIIEALGKLKEMETDLKEPEKLAGLRARADLIVQNLDKGKTEVSQVENDYQRILLEMLANRFKRDQTKRVEEDILDVLDDVLKESKEKDTYLKAKVGMLDLRKELASAGGLDAKAEKLRDATARLSTLKERLEAVANRITTSLKDIGFHREKLKKMALEVDAEKAVLARLARILAEDILDTKDK